MRNAIVMDSRGEGHGRRIAGCGSRPSKQRPGGFLDLGRPVSVGHRRPHSGNPCSCFPLRSRALTQAIGVVQRSPACTRHTQCEAILVFHQNEDGAGVFRRPARHHDGAFAARAGAPAPAHPWRRLDIRPAMRTRKTNRVGLHGCLRRRVPSVFSPRSTCLNVKPRCQAAHLIKI